MTKTKRPPLSKEQLVKANNANDAYEAGYRAGLHNTEHKKKEYDLSPEHYEIGYDDGRSDRRDKVHYQVNPKSVLRGLVKKKNSTVRINPKHRYSVDEVASGKGWYAVKDLDGYSLNYNGPNGWEYDYRTYPTLEAIYKEWGGDPNKKKNSTVRINPKSKFTDNDLFQMGEDNHIAPSNLTDKQKMFYLAGKASAAGLRDGKSGNMNAQDDYKGLSQIHYLQSYNSFRNPRKKNSTVRINPSDCFPNPSTKNLNKLEQYRNEYQKGWRTAIRGHKKIPKYADSFAYNEGYNDVMKSTRSIGIKLGHANVPLHLNDKENPNSKYHPAKEPKPGVTPWSFKHGFDDGFAEGLYPSGSFYEPTMEDDITVEYMNGWYAGYEDGEGLKETLQSGYYKGQRINPLQKPVRRFFPKIKPGRPAGGPKGGYWWILDIYDKSDKRMGHLIGKGTKEKATLDAKYKVGDKFKGKEIARAMLSGPYTKRPTSKTKRK